MKKIIVFIICLISFSSTVKAFLWEDLWLNLYNDIDEWIEDLETKQYEYELSWKWEWITESVNNLINSLWYWENYFKDWLTIEKIEKIANWELDIIYEMSENKTQINTDELKYIQWVIKNYYLETKNNAEEKANQIYYISSIWLYSDWSRENSSFDLISDLQDIDEIIFMSKLDYPWEEYENSDETLDNIIDNAKEKINLLNNIPTISDILLWNNWNNSSSNNNSTNNNNINNITNNPICPENYNQSWLDLDELNNVIYNLNNPNSSWNNNSFPIQNPPINNSNEENEENNETWSYKYVNDNSVWPCNEFFCINIDIVMYSQKLLSFWNNISIEYLLNRSNEHLKKFASTSLLPCKMTNWDFQNCLKEVNFAKMFNIWFIISHKPVPILNIETKSKEDSEYSKEKLLWSYYQDFWLDYNRKNDLKMFLKDDKKLKTILNSWGLSIKDSIKKNEELNKIVEETRKKEEMRRKSVYNKVINEELKDFEERFTELRIFTNEILNYTNNINSTINNMLNKIPTI